MNRNINTQVPGTFTGFSNFTLPHEVGIRIVVKDTDGNYTTADTNLWITTLDEDPTHIFSDDFESGVTSAWSSSVP